MDVVYYVRPGDRNEALRYSLRSLTNLPHERVWIVGHRPPWVTGIEHIPGNRRSTPIGCAMDNIALACAHVTVDEFVIFNDDFYVMEPIEAVPAWHDGLLSDRIRRAAGSYARQLMAARALLGEDAIAWTLHIPVVVERATLAEVMDGLDTRLPAEWRTMYGNLTRASGERRPDVKVRRSSEPLPAGPFMSSAPASLRRLLPVLAARFPDRSPYEVAT